MKIKTCEPSTGLLIAEAQAPNGSITLSDIMADVPGRR